MKLNGEKMIRDNQLDVYWNESRNIIIEKNFDHWRGFHTTDQWGEHVAINIEGSFRKVVNGLKKYFKEKS